MTSDPTGTASRPGPVPVSVPGVPDVYREIVLDHPSLDRALAAVERGIAPGMPPQIVLLVGSTGVGKTTLIDALVRRSCPPVVKMTCEPVVGRRGYDFGRMHWRLLAEAAGDLFPGDHVSPDEAAGRLRSGFGRRDGVVTIDEYRVGVLDMLRERGLRAVVLDEAQHMTRVPSARTQADQLDVIKYCVDRTGISHVLVGTHELSIMVAAGEQVARRSLVVHFAPYQSSHPAEREAFQRIFGQLVDALPLAEPERSWEALRTHLLDVYIGCAGCVGILKEWLCRALQLVLERGADIVDWSVMQACALSDHALSAIAEPIRAYRESKPPDREEIARALGVDLKLSARRSKGRSSARRKPGKRSPTRDPVGLPSAPKVPA